MKMHYFGWVRVRTGIPGEDVEPPAHVADVRALIGWLSELDAAHAAAFKDVSVLRVAVNQELTTLDAPVAPGDEVALFPPMTGG